jgi:quercetin dioxygenase-like cupin family protein
MSLVLATVAVRADEMVVTSFEGARFVPVDPQRPEAAQIAVLRGDPVTGPSSMLLRMAKTPGAQHYHTASYDLVLIEGRMKHWAKGESPADAKELGPGSYWHQPGGAAHGDACLTDTCVMYVQWDGKRDGYLDKGTN